MWSKALAVATSNDRIHLRTTHYNYARHLESKGEFNGAVTNYEASDTHRLPMNVGCIFITVYEDISKQTNRIALSLASCRKYITTYVLVILVMFVDLRYVLEIYFRIQINDS